MSTLPPDVQRRINRVARVVDRCQRWERLAALEDDDLEDDDLEDDDVVIDWLGNEALTEDDGAAPSGPRSSPSHSRYKLEPGHAQGLSDLLRSGQTNSSYRS